METAPTVSIVIPLYGGEEQISNCLQSLADSKQEILEVIVVDNASPDRAADVAESCPCAKVIRLPINAGYASACNRGIFHAAGDVVLLLNSDTVMPKQSLGQLIDSLFSAEDIGAAGPRTNRSGNEQQVKAEYDNFQDLEAYSQRFAGENRPDIETRQLSGFCLALKASTIARAGPFDERYELGNFEDDDLCLRIARSGLRMVISGKSFVHHEGGASMKRLDVDLQKLHDSNRQRFETKWSRVGKDVRSIRAADISTEKWTPGSVPISVIVHTRNEAKNIGACLRTTSGWADEVILADMESSDSTVEYARTYGAKVVELPFTDEFDKARNLSPGEARNDWILFLDADEHLTSEVKTTIEGLIASAPDSVSAFQLPFKTISFGNWIQHAGNWWPSYKSPPLLRKDKFHFPGPVHVPAVIDGEVVLVAPKSEDDAILHFSHPSVEKYFEKLNRYTSLEVTKLAASGRQPSWEAAADRLGAVLRWYYDDTQGSKDGLAGFLLSLGSGIYEAVSEMKFMESCGAEEIPPSASAFFERALHASRTPIGGNAEELPPWIPLLGSWLGPSNWGGWSAMRLSPDQQTEHLGNALETLVPGCFMLLRDEAELSPGDQRKLLEDRFGTACHLLEAGPDEGRWWFWWEDDEIVASHRVSSITHRNALNVMGGGEVQLFKTVKALRARGVISDVSIGSIPEVPRALCHVYSLHHGTLGSELKDLGIPYVLSPIYWDRSELGWVVPRILSLFSRSEEAIDIDAGLATLRSQRDAAVSEIHAHSKFPPETAQLITGASMVLPNAQSELDCLKAGLPMSDIDAIVVPNAVDPAKLRSPESVGELNLPEKFVLCVGRIEPNKNQLMLLWAMRETNIPVVLIGSFSHPEYEKMCREIAPEGTVFLGPQNADVVAYALSKASVHCLPSFAETPGLVNLEAAALGCPIVVGNRSAESEYFGKDAHYCDPLDPASIRNAVLNAITTTNTARTNRLQKKVTSEYTWGKTAEQIAEIYERFF